MALARALQLNGWKRQLSGSRRPFMEAPSWVQEDSVNDEVAMLLQEYERLAERRYRYTSAGGAFTVALEVDDEGLVLDYEGVWERVRGM